jgi:hypothetical protein
MMPLDDGEGLWIVIQVQLLVVPSPGSLRRFAPRGALDFP